MTPDRVRDQVLASRREQGLPDQIPAGRFLDDLAAQVLDQAGPLQVDGDGEPVRLIANPSTPDGRPAEDRKEVDAVA
jgi:hypothetical protein